MNIESSDCVMHHIPTQGRLPYPPPPDGFAAQFMAFNMGLNRVPTAPQVNRGQIPSDIVPRFDNTQFIDPSFSTGVVANPMKSVVSMLNCCTACAKLT
jgi:hypothetical protein